MNIEAQRMAIAEACGWKPASESKKWWTRPAHFKISGSARGTDGLPDFLNDLNAMHEAEKRVMEPSKPYLSNPQEPDIYMDNLRKLTGGKLMNHESLITFSHGSF